MLFLSLAVRLDRAGLAWILNFRNKTIKTRANLYYSDTS